MTPRLICPPGHFHAVCYIYGLDSHVVVEVRRREDLFGLERSNPIYLYGNPSSAEQLQQLLLRFDNLIRLKEVRS